jgi:hypothetical protein
MLTDTQWEIGVPIIIVHVFLQCHIRCQILAIQFLPHPRVPSTHLRPSLANPVLVQYRLTRTPTKHLSYWVKEHPVLILSHLGVRLEEGGQEVGSRVQGV